VNPPSTSGQQHCLKRDRILRVPQMKSQALAAVAFFAGALIVAAPLVLRLGWLAGTSGIVLGVALGAVSGVLWASAKTTEGITLDERWV
jgi:hypothetical protein